MSRSRPRRASLLAAHRPPDEEQHQRQHAAGFGEQDPRVVHAQDSSPAPNRPARIPARAALALAALCLAGCATAQPAPQTLERLPGWSDDALAGLHRALARQCALPRPPQPWPALCTGLPPADALKGWIGANFTAWPIERGDGAAGLLTGYFEPVVSGSRAREHAGQAPLYRPPRDLVRGADGARMRAHPGDSAAAGAAPSQRALAPYPTRAEIETGRLLEGQELVWLDDPVDAFFVQVQGSGRVRLRDGGTMRVGFADHNGQPYFPIGRELVARGALPAGAVDADAIKAWLRAHPEEAAAVMRKNPRFVFFRELPGGDDGPPGSLGVALTPMRSVATDPAYVPPGALLFIDSTRPDDGAPLRRVVVSQDRGAAITGAARADLFWGSGDEAGRLAGLTKQPVRMWLLWPKGSPRPALPGPPGAALSPSSSRPASG
jgi:membrane-bound lytic murein transglycosylase A